MVKNVGYALPLFGKFSRMDAMSHRYKATEIYRKKKQWNIHFKTNSTYSWKFITEKNKKH